MGCFPIIGLLFAVPAVVLGVLALSRQRTAPGSYGSVTSDMRAILGVIVGTLTTLLWGGLLVWMYLNGTLR